MSPEKAAEIAKRWGAKFIGHVPGAHHGGVGLANFLGFHQMRQRELQAQEMAAANASDELRDLAVRVRQPTLEGLRVIATRLSTPTNPVDAQQVAETVLDSVISKLAGQIHDAHEMAIALQQFDSVNPPPAVGT